MWRRRRGERGVDSFDSSFGYKGSEPRVSFELGVSGEQNTSLEIGSGEGLMLFPVPTRGEDREGVLGKSLEEPSDDTRGVVRSNTFFIWRSMGKRRTHQSYRLFCKPHTHPTGWRHTAGIVSPYPGPLSLPSFDEKEKGVGSGILYLRVRGLISAILGIVTPFS